MPRITYIMYLWRLYIIAVKIITDVGKHIWSLQIDFYMSKGLITYNLIDYLNWWDVQSKMGYTVYYDLSSNKKV